MELPSTSIRKTVSDAGGPRSPELESVAGATTTAAAFFNEKTIAPSLVSSKTSAILITHTW